MNSQKTLKLLEYLKLLDIDDLSLDNARMGIFMTRKTALSFYTVKFCLVSKAILDAHFSILKSMHRFFYFPPVPFSIAKTMHHL